MKKLFYIALSFVLVATTLTSCEDWLDVNVSPDNPTTVTCDVVLPATLFFSVQGCYDNAEYNAYLSQCLTTTGKSQSSSYSYKYGWGGFMDMNRHPMWRRHFYDIGVNNQYLISDAMNKKMYNYVLIAKTLNLYSLLITTDEFGEIACSQSYVERTPDYDRQELIYDSIGRACTELLALYERDDWMNAPTNGQISAYADRMFQGDMECWRAFAKAIYAKYLLRNIPNMNNTPEMCQKIIDAVDAALADPGWTKKTGALCGGPVYKFGNPTTFTTADGNTYNGTESKCMWGPTQPKMNLGWAQARDNQLDQAVPGSLMANIMCFYSGSVNFDDKKATIFNPEKKAGISSYALDPRAERMFEPRADATGKKALRSLQNNRGMDVTYGTDYKATYFPDLFCTTDKTNPYTRDDGYITFITTEELLFAKAEALYWKGDVEAARTTTIEAVEASFKRYGVREYLSSRKNAMGQRYEDELINAFIKMRIPTVAGEDITYEWKEGRTTKTFTANIHFNISHIMQQKFVAMYLQAEQWTDVRRYNQSSSSNGISYKDMTTGGGVFVYDVSPVYVDATSLKETSFDIQPQSRYSLRRPYNIYPAHWETALDAAESHQISANAWINRLQPDPETEDKYNRENIEKWGAYKNPNYLRKRQIWQMPTKDNGALVTKGEGEWMMQYGTNN